MKIRSLLLTTALLVPIAALADPFPPTAIVAQPPPGCPAPVPVCNTPSYMFPGATVTPTNVAAEVTKCIKWKIGTNSGDKNQCFGAFQDIISLQDCDAVAFNYLLYNPSCTPKPVR